MTDTPSRAELTARIARVHANQAILAGRISDLEARLDTALRGSEQRAARLDALEAGQGHLRDDMSMVGADVAGLLERSSHPTPHPDPRCEAVSPDDAEARCYLWEGHYGEHVSWPVALKWNDGHTLDDHCPICFGCCAGDGPAPCPFCGGEDCAGQVEPPGCPACDGVAGTACRCPEPVPQWRQMVDDASGDGGLPSVLYGITRLAEIAEGKALDRFYADAVQINLARIVAVCEAQVGDGWQAEPSAIFGACMSVRALIKEGWTADGHPRWQGLANAAAAWLRDLTQDGAQ